MYIYICVCVKNKGRAEKEMDFRRKGRREGYGMEKFGGKDQSLFFLLFLDDLFGPS